MWFTGSKWVETIRKQLKKKTNKIYLHSFYYKSLIFGRGVWGIIIEQQLLMLCLFELESFLFFLWNFTFSGHLYFSRRLFFCRFIQHQSIPSAAYFDFAAEGCWSQDAYFCGWYNSFKYGDCFVTRILVAPSHIHHLWSDLEQVGSELETSLHIWIRYSFNAFR